MSITEQRPQREPKRRWAARWGVSVRTVDRWNEEGLLGGDALITINGRDYIRIDCVPAKGKPKRFTKFSNPEQ